MAATTHAQTDADGSFVPPDFVVPQVFVDREFRLVPLAPEYNERDYAAWSTSVEHIKSTPGFEKYGWPHTMTAAENMRDVRRHFEDFQRRVGFTYSVLVGGDVVGCVYIYPGDRPGGAVLRSWVREDRADLDEPVHRAVLRWLQQDWPFTDVSRWPRNKPRQPVG